MLKEEGFFCKGGCGDGTNIRWYGLYKETDDLIRFRIQDGTTSSVVSASRSISDGKWHHIAGVRTSSTTLVLYIDGAQDATATVTARDTDGTVKDIIIGRDEGLANGNFWNGSIDEIRVSNVARSADEIAEGYRAGRDHRIGRSITADLSSAQKMPFYVASDRQGTFAQTVIGESAYANGEADTNTLGLWRLEEAAGSGAYLKDSSGGSYNMTPANVTSVLSKFGKGLRFNGSSSYTESSSLTYTKNALTLEAWVYPTTVDGSDRRIVSFDASSFIRQEGATSGKFNYGLDGTGTCFKTANLLPVANNWYHLVMTADGSNLRLYINGVLDSSVDCSTSSTAATTVTLGKYPGGSSQYFAGTIDEVRVSNTARTADQIRQAYEVGARSHNITVDFKANLLSTDLITSTADTSFNIDSTVYGVTNKGDNLYIGDTVIVKENVDGTEYLVQGVVTAVTSSTGATTVSSWSGTAPTGGFTTSATVFKWQREYFDVTSSLCTDTTSDALCHRKAITRLTLRPTDTSSGANVYLDDIKYSTPYLTTSGAAITSTANRYIQYRAIFSSTDPALSATLGSVTLDYTTGPTTSQLMRHGKWFSGEAFQPFWFAR